MPLTHNQCYRHDGLPSAHHCSDAPTDDPHCVGWPGVKDICNYRKDVTLEILINTKIYGSSRCFPIHGVWDHQKPHLDPCFQPVFMQVAPYVVESRLGEGGFHPIGFGYRSC